MSSRKNVSANEVRAWGRANLDKVPEAGRKCLGETARGRLHPDLIAAYRKHNKNRTYETGSQAELPTVTVPVVGVDKNGRKTTRQVTVTTVEGRKILGQTGRKGRFNLSLLSEALSAQVANEVADQFTKAV
jgi:hypothetical protein